MLSKLVRWLLAVCLFAASAVCAETSSSSAEPNSNQGVSASVSIRITVKIPVRATLKLSADQQHWVSSDNLPSSQRSKLTCHSQQGLPLAGCAVKQSDRIYTLTTL